MPVVNLGFSGSGVMELEMSEHIARIDASCAWLRPLRAAVSEAGAAAMFLFQ